MPRRLASRQEVGRSRPASLSSFFPLSFLFSLSFFLPLLLSLSLFSLLFSRSAAAADTDPPLQLDWHIQRHDGQLAVQPTVTSLSVLPLRYELVTLDQPSRRIRQAGQAELQPGQPQALARLALGPVAPPCRLRLTLWLPDGPQYHDIDPCLTKD